MTIVRIKGAIGNQLFQYAFGRARTEARNEPLFLDLSSFAHSEPPGDIRRPFSLNAFNTTYEIADDELVQKARYPYGLLSKLKERTYDKVAKKLGVVNENTVARDPQMTYFDGYWQSPQYFEHIRPQLLHECTLREPMGAAATSIREQIDASDVSVSIHVRRGDYIHNPRVRYEFGNCSTRYYREAIETIKALYPNATFFVFSNDIDWVQNNLVQGEQMVFVSNTDISDPEDLILMSTCDHNIIANSSFSWWAAWLNQNTDKTIIAPTPWFDTVPYDPSLIPESWIQLQK